MTNTETLQNRWLLGSDAPPALSDFPEAWRETLAELEPEQQSLTALGLMAHYQSLAECAGAPEPLTPAPLLPPLNLAMIDAAAPTAYPLVTRLLAEDSDYVKLTLALLAERGLALPPRDYFVLVASRREVAKDLSPEVATIYQPWQRHFATRQNEAEPDDNLAIDADNWADFMPAYRLYALETLRSRDPNACRDLIAECVGQEPAETRVKILHVLYEQLSDADAPYLQTLLNDRSKKVVALARQLLLRIGHFGRDAAEDDAEVDLELLAKGFEVNAKQSKLKTLLGKPTEAVEVKAVLYREHKKRNKRRELLSQYGLPALAEALSISLPQLLNGWAYNKHRADDNRTFIEQASHLPDEFLPLMVEGLASYEFDYPDEILPIWRRLSDAQRQTLLLSYLHNAELDLRFAQLLTFGTRLADNDKLTWKSLQKTTAWRQLCKPNKYHQQTEHDCIALGLLLPQALATVALVYLQENLDNEAIGRNDLAFYALRLNAALANHPIT